MGSGFGSCGCSLQYDVCITVASTRDGSHKERARYAAGPMTSPAPPDQPGRRQQRPGLEKAPPPVVAVVVSRNAGPFLEEALAALGAQDYPTLSVLVVDAGSQSDPTSRVGAALPTAFVRRLSGSPGFGGAANEALAAVQGAQFFLVCHDDVVFDPTAIRVMVEEAFRSNAAIVGPKLVDADDPSILLEVGRTIDRFGGPHTGIEPGEVDQEQHDAVRDVFYVSSAAMLIRSDLFDELDGFDPDTFPGAEDLDLCWRALLAGARVMVAPDARARHHEAADERSTSDAPHERELARNRVRVALTCYSFRSLLWAVPVGLTVAFVEAVAFAPTRRRSEGFARLGAWWWNLLHFGRLRPARKRAQALRRVHDGELRELQVGAGASVGAFLTEHRADRRMEMFGERTRDALEALGESLRHPASVAFVAFVAFVLLGSRDLFSQGVPAVGDLVPWTGVRSMVTEVSSAWRHTGLGSTSAAPPALAMMAALGTVLLGGIGLAQTLVVVGAFVVGSTTAFRLARGLGGSHGAGAITAVVYGVAAVPRNAVANGRLGPLVLYALAPAIVLLVIRAAGFGGTAGTSRRPLLGLVIITALATAWFPPAALVGIVVAIAFLVATPITGDALAAVRALGAAVVGALGAAVLLVPWTTTLVDAGSDGGALGASFRPRLELLEVLRFESGPNGAGFAAWGLITAAAAALVLADGQRLAWVTRGWALAIVGYGAAYLPSRLAPGAAVPAPEAALALAALGLAIAAGVGVGALAELLTDKRMGWRQTVGAISMAGVVIGSLGFMADTIDGRWRASVGWHDALSFTQDKQFQGDFRVLWLGDPGVLPVDPFELDADLSYSLTRNGPGDGREILRAPETDADRVVSRAVQVARRGETARLGRMLALAGVRYIGLALRSGPEGTLGLTPPGVGRALADQLDLARLGSPPGLVLYENQSWVPARAVVTGRRAASTPVDSPDPLRAAAEVDLAGSRRLGGGPVPEGTVLLAEAYDGGWAATSGGRTLEHGRAFGFTNSWELPARGTVGIAHSGQGTTSALLALQLALWVAALVWWSRGRRAARAETRGARAERRIRERQPKGDFFEDLSLANDEDFWEPV